MKFSHIREMTIASGRLAINPITTAPTSRVVNQMSVQIIELATIRAHILVLILFVRNKIIYLTKPVFVQNTISDL